MPRGSRTREETKRLFKITISLFVLVGAITLWRLLDPPAGGIGPVEIVAFGLVLFAVLPWLFFRVHAREEASIESFHSALDASKRELERSELQLAKVLHSVVDPIIVIDAEGIVLECNSAVMDVFGYQREELIGGPVHEIMAEPFRSEHGGYIESYLATGITKAIGRVRRVVGERKSGDEFPCEISISEMPAADGAAPNFVGIVRDVTERERMSSMLLQAERLAAVGELAAGVAHEVNNPINTVLNCAQLIKDGDTDPLLADDILAEGKRIASIVRDLLDFAKDRQDGVSSVRVSEVLERTISLVARRIEKQGFRIETDVPNDLPVIHARSQQLQQVFLNLILNARDALTAARSEGIDPGTQGFKIEVASTEVEIDHRSWVRVRVRDNGIGIEKKNLDRVFQPFFTTKRGSGGTGLGLSVSMGIIRAHNGRLHVSSETHASGTERAGTEFSVDLPVSSAEDPDFDSVEGVLDSLRDQDAGSDSIEGQEQS